MGAREGDGVGSGGDCAAGSGGESGGTVEEDFAGSVAAVAARGGAGIADVGEAAGSIRRAAGWGADLFFGSTGGHAVAGNIACGKCGARDTGDWARGWMDRGRAGGGDSSGVSGGVVGEFDFADGDGGDCGVGEY